MTDSRVLCVECRVYVGVQRTGYLARHSVDCSHASVEDRAAQALDYANAWRASMKIRDRLNQEITAWQGRYHTLRLENNALRRKLRRQTPPRKDGRRERP